ncbi:MAG: hypothetical protein ACLQDY_07350 [Streptosporangiaceae bacterium]
MGEWGPVRQRGRGRTGQRAGARALRAMVLALAGSALAAGCASSPASHPAAQGSGPARPTATARTPTTSQPTVTASPTAASAPSGGRTVIPVPPPPARLHQTRKFPSAHTRVFRAEMTDLWAAIVTGRARLGRQAFFPITAYTQIKAIYDPAADWHDRLFHDFRLDVAAAHRYLGRGARRARLVRVMVPASEAAWIVPGVCDNSGSYWHVGGARLVYREHHQLRSIGIASLISWRGRWYVVHFGAVLRSGDYGIVDSPAVGPGIPGPAGGC